MIVCPKCGASLEEVEEDIIGRTFGVDDKPNEREGICPECGIPLKFFIKVRIVKVVVEQSNVIMEESG